MTRKTRAKFQKTISHDDPLPAAAVESNHPFLVLPHGDSSKQIQEPFYLSHSKSEDHHLSVFSLSVESGIVCVQVTGGPWTQNAIQRLGCCLWNLASPSRFKKTSHFLNILFEMERAVIWLNIPGLLHAANMMELVQQGLTSHLIARLSRSTE